MKLMDTNSFNFDATNMQLSPLSSQDILQIETQSNHQVSSFHQSTGTQASKSDNASNSTGISTFKNQYDKDNQMLSQQVTPCISEKIFITFGTYK